jgi:radical SAM protein with 4Fe4S-binding SPASM domain
MTVFEGFPCVVGWELTLACNLRCRHCASSAGSPRAKELTLEESLAICEQLPALLVDEVIFTGGEPFMNPHWQAIAARLRDLSIKTGVVTNGLCITDGLIERMKDCGLVAAGVSLDGTREAHDALRGAPGSFEKTVQGIGRLARGGIDLTVITSVTGLNVHSLPEIWTLVSGLGAWKWQLQPLFPRGRGESDLALSLTDQQFLELGRFIHASHSAAKERGLRIVPADSCGYYSPLDIEEYPWSACKAGRSGCGIMSDGRVKGCLSWPDSTVEGDLRTEDLWTIWFKPNAFRQLREFESLGVKGKCQGCEVAAQCGGGCQAMSLAAAGDWHSDPFCYRRILGHSGSQAMNPGDLA